jgi:hypothetical protein
MQRFYDSTYLSRLEAERREQAERARRIRVRTDVDASEPPRASATVAAVTRLRRRIAASATDTAVVSELPLAVETDDARDPRCA